MDFNLFCFMETVKTFEAKSETDRYAPESTGFHSNDKEARDYLKRVVRGFYKRKYQDELKLKESRVKAAKLQDFLLSFRSPESGQCHSRSLSASSRKMCQTRHPWASLSCLNWWQMTWRRWSNQSARWSCGSRADTRKARGTMGLWPGDVFDLFVSVSVLSGLLLKLLEQIPFHLPFNKW